MDAQCKLHEDNINLKLTGIAARLEALQEMNAMSMAHHSEKLDKIYKQTKETNGRVTALEKETSLWRWLSAKPFRLVISVTIIIILSKLVTNDQIINLIIKLFS